MPSLDLLCLANSYKHDPGRCIAGLRLDGKGWVRCVSTHGEGELHLHECLLGGDTEPRVLDVIRVGLARREPTPWQPENCVIDGSAWQLLERPAAPAHARTLAAAVDPGPLLFGNAAAKLAQSALEAAPAAASLTLVKPECVSWVRRSFGGTRRVRVRFHLGSCGYELPLTDPSYAESLRALPEGEHPGAAIGIPAGANLLLTVSLAAPYQGFCYKLVANVVIVPAAWQPQRAVTASAR